MKAWNDRPAEVANLLNPAFCSLGIATAAAEFAGRQGSGMPYPIAFLVLPIALHGPTRESRPRNVRTSLAAWIQLNPEAKVRFPERVAALEPVTREALIFGASQGVLDVSQEGLVLATGQRSGIDRAITQLAGEAGECLRAAKFVGRWLAGSGSTATTLALWGVRA